MNVKRKTESDLPDKASQFLRNKNKPQTLPTIMRAIIVINKECKIMYSRENDGKVIKVVFKQIPILIGPCVVPSKCQVNKRKSGEGLTSFF